MGSQSLKLPFDALTRTLLAWWGIVPYPISCARAKQIRRHPTIYLYERRILIFMTSQERHEARYQRRKAKRQARKQARCNALGPMEKIFSYRKMFFYGKKCCNGVRWKQSVQNFEGHLFSGTANRRRKVLDQNWKPMKCTHFTLCERGKVRPIDAPHITDRQIHKALCNEVLTPLYGPCMIHDNGASQKGEGPSLALPPPEGTASLALPEVWPGRCGFAVGFERLFPECAPCASVPTAPRTNSKPQSSGLG